VGLEVASVSATRILVLGLLAVRGPMHGHQLRRVAEMMNVEAWGDVKVGALYGAIHRLEAEDLIQAIRSEQEGRFPARTVYAITDEGREELAILRSRALQEARLAPDPFDIALTFVDAPLAEVEPLLAQRRASLAGQLFELVSERERLEALGQLTRLSYLVFRHGEARLRSELAYLDEIAPLVPAALDERDAQRAAASSRAGAADGDVVPLETGRRRAAGRQIRRRGESLDA
jgi:DNA-binding PadR family transcriptional regulator